MAEGDVTRGEFDMLKEKTGSMERRIESIDNHGTRGVGALQIQVVEVLKDIAEIKVQFTSYLSEHVRTHREEKDQRLTERHWLIGIGIAGVSALAAILAVVVVILQHTS